MRHQFFGLLLTIAIIADTGYADEPFPEVYNSEADASVPLTAAEAAVGMFDLPDGFTATVFASEPDVRNPIAMAWDWKGRLWVAENYTYAEKAKRFELDLKDRVLIFEDTDWDGIADKRSVFSEDLQMLTSVEVGRGGVWVMCPPRLLFIPDRNGDDVPDAAPEVMLDGFTVGQSSYHNFANGLRWGPDGWLYGRSGHSCPGRLGSPGTPDAKRVPIKGGIWRYHPERKVVEVLTHGTTNPWGHDWDQHGELFFINTVNGHLWHGIPGAHFPESFGMDPNPYVYDRIDTHADHYHYDRSGKWSESRDGAANVFGGGHAHIGMMIYQGDRWPEPYQNRLFTLNMHGRRANVERLDREGSGFVGRHESDVFVTEDPWFRGIDIRQGPDGSAFILDWSDIGECHEHTGVHRTSGRIYRISHGDVEKPNFDDLKDFNVRAAMAMSNPNPWYERQVRSRIGSGVMSQEFMQICWPILRGKAELPIKLRALWALNAMGRKEHLSSLFYAEEEQMRAWAIRLVLDESPIDTIKGPLPENMPVPASEELFSLMLGMAESDESGLVRLTLASALQRLPLKQRGELGMALSMRPEDANDHNLPEMVWYGISPLAESDPLALVRIAEQSSWPDLKRWISRCLSSRMGEDLLSIEGLMSAIESADPESQLVMMNGISEGLKGWREAPEPEAWQRLKISLEDTKDENLIRHSRGLSVLFGDGRALDEVKQIANDPSEDTHARIAALETLIQNPDDDLREICEALMSDRVLCATAAKGLALFDDPELGIVLAKRYPRFYPADKPGLVEILASRKAWAEVLLKEIEEGRIDRTDLSAFQARQIRGFDDPALNKTLASVWGVLRETDEAKRELINEWTAKLNDEFLAKADLIHGRNLFAGICGACHVMYGDGMELGPDLTGSNRYDLSYLLENVFDPGSEVSADYQMTVVSLNDGRVLTGVVSDETDKILTLRQAAEITLLEKSAILTRDKSTMSMMPDGLLLAFSDEQVRDLIGYLMHPVQVEK